MTRNCMRLGLVLIVMMILAGGCAKDQQVMVTPFVLKHSSAPEVSSAQPPNNISPAVNSYEELIRKNNR